ncbi:hypothetical protein WN51_10815 [Melipona quadrifasciata]|uniref:Uncharacterized protein n=1 Tax=Melipona quadrifasciata TaxID=166423 RepID=A0A0M9A6N7_9HYME|nr:hypothetical protein WN51_10815 [Melipona quadrifasciata]
MKTDNELPLIGISGTVQCLLEHGSVKGNRISPRSLRSQVLKADGASRGLVAKCMHYPGGKSQYDNDIFLHRAATRILLCRRQRVQCHNVHFCSKLLGQFPILTGNRLNKLIGGFLCCAL